MNAVFQSALIGIALAWAPLTVQAQDFTRLDVPRPVADIAFQDETGKTHHLSDYRGRPLLLNIWATWCLPCITELPTLDRLAAAQDSQGIVVLALSVDRKGMPAIRRFFDENAIRHLAALADPAHEALQQLGASSLPATLFIDAQGREIARRHIGPLAWDTPETRLALNVLFRKESKP